MGETPARALCWSRGPAARTAEQGHQPGSLAQPGHRAVSACEKARETGRGTEALQEQASPPVPLWSLSLLLGFSAQVLMDIMALPPLKCLPLPPPRLWELENGLLGNLRGVKVGGSDIQLSYQPVGHTEGEGGKEPHQSKS